MMKAIFLRRRKLGLTSCREIVNYMHNPAIVHRSDKPAPTIENDGIKYLFRWGTTSTFPRQGCDVVVVNTPASIHWCNDKKQSRLELQANGMSVPFTWPSLEMWAEYWEQNTSFIRRPVVVRPATHSRGLNLYVLENPNDIGNVPSWVAADCYVSHKIDKVAEYRVFVCQNRVAWVARKTPGNPDDVAWNVAQGGRFDNVRWGDWPLRVVDVALHAAQVSGTDFSGVDVMASANGTPYVLEVNSAPSQTSPYRQQCVAKCFDYIVEHGKEHFETPPAISSWKDVIHPALRQHEE